MKEITKRVEELEKYQNRIVASIKELNTNNQELKEKVGKLEEENERLRMLLNTNRTDIIIEQTKIETELKKIFEKFQQLEIIKDRPGFMNERAEKPEMPMPLYFGNPRDIYPKKFLAELEKYLAIKKITDDDQMIVVENALKLKAASWFSMMKFASSNFEKFKTIFFQNLPMGNIYPMHWEKKRSCTDTKHIFITG